MYKHCKNKQSALRQKHIAEQFLKLTKTTPLKQITITDISHASDIPRKGFYRYFDGIDDIVDFILEKTIQEETEYISKMGISIDTSPQEYLIAWLRFWKSKSDLISLFQDRSIHSAMVHHAIHHMSPVPEKASQDLMPTPIMVRNLFAAYGTMALLEVWHRNNYQIPDDVMVGYMLQLLTEPLFPERQCK